MKKLVALLLLALPLSGLALDIDSARAQGLVGEKANGYLGVIVDRPEVVELVKTINLQRRARFKEVAAKRGASLEAIEQLAGEKLIEKAKAEHYPYQTADGAWSR